MGLKDVTVFQVVCYVLVHLIGSLLLVGCLIMDVLLRGSTDPVSSLQSNTLTIAFCYFPN